MKNWKKITAVVLVAAVSIGGYYAYDMYTAGPGKIENAKPAMRVAATLLLDDYNKSEKEANKKYIGKIIEVSGEIKEVSKNQEGQTIINLKTADPMNSINCTLEQQTVPLQTGQQVIVKGLCTGYMMDVYLTRCYIVK